MRLLFVTRRYWPAVGGVESFLRDVARELATRHQVTVLALRTDDGRSGILSDGLLRPPPFEPFDDGPVQVRPLQIGTTQRVELAPLAWQVVPGLRRYAWGRARIPTARLYARAVTPAIAQAAAQADIVHAWAGDLIAAAAVRAARRSGIPSVVMASLHPGQWGDDPASAATFRAADAVVAQLQTEANDYHSLGVDRRRIAVCGACSPGVAGGRGGELRDRQRIGGPLVLFLGVRRPYKGWDLLLEAAPSVAARHPNATFAFVGPGPAVGASGARVIDAGAVDDDERAAWLDAADVLCLPSAGESFGVVVLEAWSVGTPVLVSDIPSLRELVGPGGGWIAERTAAAFSKALIEILNNPAAQRATGEEGQRRWLAEYTVKAVAGRHEDLYRSLIDRANAGQRRAA